MSERLLLATELALALRAAGLDSAGALLALGDPREARRFVGFVDLDVPGTAGRFHLKRYRYAGWRASLGLLGRGTLWGAAPQVREFRGLAFLRRHGIPAVRPVAACATSRHGRLVAHALLTEVVPDARDLEARLRDAGDPLRATPALRWAVCRTLGRHLAAMHALGFVHRDCHARNVLVRLVRGSPEVWFLDCRRGGLAGRGGALDDLATLDRDVRGVLSRTDRLRALRAWLGSTADAKPVLRGIARRRERLPPPR